MIEISGISVGYKGRTVLKDFSLSIDGHDCILLKGLNGSGKTTLMKALAGLLPLSGGSMSGAGRIVMVPTRIPKVKGFTLRQFVATSCPDPEAVSRALAALGLEELAERDISTLSDGQFQKGCIATGLSRRAGLLLLDEPTAFLDYKARESVLEVIRGIADAGTPVIFSSHDIAAALPFATRVVELPSGLDMD